jgi:hypothetical protein
MLVTLTPQCRAQESYRTKTEMIPRTKEPQTKLSADNDLWSTPWGNEVGALTSAAIMLFCCPACQYANTCSSSGNSPLRRPISLPAQFGRFRTALIIPRLSKPAMAFPKNEPRWVLGFDTQ